MPKSFEIM
jgi:acyl-coenzyme A synthetase/AMP-(fatty) acid ligase